MQDMNKLKREIGYLQQMFGQDNIVWDKNYEWLLIDNFLLPPGINKDRCRLVIIIPPHYGNGSPIIDSFIEPGLKARNTSGEYAELEHYFKVYAHNERLLTFGTKAQWAEQGWWWLCLQNKAKSYNAETIDQYKTNVWKFLNEPFQDWSELFQAYNKEK